MMEDIFVIYNEKTQGIYRATNWAGGRPTLELKTWKTLAGATKALAKINKPNLVIKKLAVKDINEE